MGWAWVFAIALLIWSPVGGGIIIMLVVGYTLLSHYGPTLELWKANQEAQFVEREKAKRARLEAGSARLETAALDPRTAELDARIAGLEAEVAELDAKITALDAEGRRPLEAEVVEAERDEILRSLEALKAGLPAERYPN